MTSIALINHFVPCLAESLPILFPSLTLTEIQMILVGVVFPPAIWSLKGYQQGCARYDWSCTGPRAHEVTSDQRAWRLAGRTTPSFAWRFGDHNGDLGIIVGYVVCLEVILKVWRGVGVTFGELQEDKMFPNDLVNGLILPKSHLRTWQSKTEVSCTLTRCHFSFSRLSSRATFQGARDMISKGGRYISASIFDLENAPDAPPVVIDGRS